MKNKAFISLLILICLPFISIAEPRPDSFYAVGNRHHIQGIAFDKSTSNMYMSFTTSFLVVDRNNSVLGSVDKIHGHLGAMTFDPECRKVYASLECKNDEIGSNISKGLGVQQYNKPTFYIAEIDVDAITQAGASQDAVINRLQVHEAIKDYGKKFGCTGIDGITIGPDFGGKGGEFLYVAYGVKSDTTRSDNDYQVLLQYKMSDIRKGNTSRAKKYFVKTGNTTYGVQNLAYDPFTNMMFMAVYKGKKRQYPNYDLFAVDMASKPVMAKLEGVPYEKKAVKTIPLAGEGWYFKFGPLGLCPLGDGYWYIAEGGKIKDPVTGKKRSTGKVVLYQWLPDSSTPFKKKSLLPVQEQPGKHIVCP